MGVFISVVNLWLISIYFEPAEYGHYSLFMSVVTISTFLLSSWTTTAFLRYGREEWKTHHQMGEVLASESLYVFGGICLGCLLVWIFRSSICGLLNVKSSPLVLLYLLYLGIAFLPLPTIGIIAGQATGRPLSLGYVPLIQKIALLVGIALLGGLLGKRLWTVLAAFTVAGAGVAGILALGRIPKNAWKRFRPSREMCARIFRYSWAYPIGMTGAYVVQWVDIWVIRICSDSTDVGLYSWAYQIISLGTIAFSTLSMLLSPRMIDAGIDSDMQKFESYARRILGTMVLFSCLALPILPLIRPIMFMLVSSKYHPVYPSLIILISSMPFTLLGYLITPMGTPFEKLVPQWMLISVTISIINTLLDILLVPRIGAIGAAIGTSFAFAFGGFAQARLIFSYLKGSFPPIRRLLMFTILIPAGIAITFIHRGLFTNLLALFLLAATAALASKAMKVFSKEDVEWLEQQNLPDTLRKFTVCVLKWACN